MKISKELYGTTKEGREVYSFTIANLSGAYIELVSYGATLNKIVVPDSQGRFNDVLVGFDTMEGQELCTDSQGRTVGRVANRIDTCGITVDGKNYQITKNVNNDITLHSNHEYETAVWDYEIKGDDTVVFIYHSPAGAEGFPGEVDNEVSFTFTEENEVILRYNCKPTEKCPLNVTNHSYFNLNGFDGGTVLDHEVQFNCYAYTPTDDRAIPTGEIRSVEGTVFDFRSPKTIGRDVEADDIQLKIGRGYDHNFCIEGYDGTLRKYAVVKSKKSGRVMECFTDLPGVQFYIGNFMDGTQTGKKGLPLNYRTGFCLETQYYPDAINHPEFIQNVFTPDKPFVSTSIYKFSIE